MQNWNPILSGPLREKGEAILSRIGEKLSGEFEAQQESNLLNGLAGQLLFLSEYYQDYNTIAPVVQRLFSKIASDNNLDGSLMKGLAGIGYALKIIDRQLSILDTETETELYTYVRRFMGNDLRNSTFDYMFGYFGECAFLLLEDHNDTNEQLFRQMLDVLRQQAVPQSVGIGWVSLREMKIVQPGVEPADLIMDVNIGMAHGLPGQIAVLSRLQQHYPGLPTAELLKEAHACLKNVASTSNFNEHGFYYPSFAGPLAPKYTGQLSWCYSDLGIAMMYLSLWELSGKQEYLDLATSLADACHVRRSPTSLRFCAGLCHGVAGYAHMFNRLYQKTGHDRYKTTAIYWFELLFDQLLVIPEEGFIYAIDYDKNEKTYCPSANNGFLEGLAGIGLTIKAGVSDTTPQWDSLLLM